MGDDQGRTTKDEGLQMRSSLIVRRSSSYDAERTRRSPN
jgi:hypothetical protein